MHATELTDLSLAQAAALIKQGALSPLELTEAYLRRIGQLNPTINAYITVTADRAWEDARRATTAIAAGTYRGPLHGIPIALKDVFATAGIRTTAGSKIHGEWVPDKDSTVVRKLREGGAVMLGKLNMHEYGAGVTTNNPHFGPTRNPWKLDCVPGGSSGGSAAAIAAGMAAATMGSDTAGSVRMPAALCGVVGLKPTYGRVSKAGVVPMAPSLDHVGPITRTVEDAALMLQLLAGYDPDDFSTVRTAIDDYTSNLRDGIVGLRVGVPRAYFYERLDDDVRVVVQEALDAFQKLGARIQDVDIPGVGTLPPGMWAVEAREVHAEALAARPDDFGRDVYALLTGPTPSGTEIAAQRRIVHAVTEAMRRTLEEVDVLVTPTMIIPAARIGQQSVRWADREERLGAASIRCTQPFNATQLPALSVPCGFTREGLPVGLQFVGRPFDEATVLRTGYCYEQATEWHTRRPSGVEGRVSEGGGTGSSNLR
jgi:aspartyl-tRNA(Asn)/glutamyl-tRNA(Gln) amidotransferase subunit A